MTKRKATGRTGTPFDLTMKEREAVQDFAATYQKALPNMQIARAVAQRVYSEMIKAPVMGIVEAPKPQEFSQPPPEMWTVGHANVNYVDHIETEQDQ